MTTGATAYLSVRDLRAAKSDHTTAVKMTPLIFQGSILHDFLGLFTKTTHEEDYSLESPPQKPESTAGSGNSNSRKDGNSPIIISWISLTNPSNPSNWPLWRKSLAATQIYLYTSAI